MKKIYILIILFGLNTNCSIQKQNLNSDCLSYILKNQIFDKGETRIVKELNKEIAEHFLQQFISNKTLKFTNPNWKIQLTEKEKEFILSSIEAQYGYKWNESDFPKYKIVESEDDTTNFLISSKDNRVLMLSKPILIRNNGIAFSFVAHFGFGQRPEYIGYRLYYKKNGIWNNWIDIN